MDMKETKELVYMGLKAGELIASLEDGFSLGDLSECVTAAKAVPAGIKDVAKVLTELSAATPEDRDALKAYVSENFDLPNDKVEEGIESAIHVAIELSELIALFKKA